MIKRCEIYIKFVPRLVFLHDYHSNASDHCIVPPWPVFFLQQQQQDDYSAPGAWCCSTPLVGVFRHRRWRCVVQLHAAKSSRSISNSRIAANRSVIVILFCDFPPFPRHANDIW
jgi:hypothetical protein